MAIVKIVDRKKSGNRIAKDISSISSISSIAYVSQKIYLRCISRNILKRLTRIPCEYHIAKTIMYAEGHLRNVMRIFEKYLLRTYCIGTAKYIGT